MADTAKVELRYIEEVTWGTCPPTPTMKQVRLTSETFGNKLSTTKSNEIRSDRQVTDLILTGVDPVGDVAFELSYDAYDEWIEGVLFSDWTGVGGGATEVITAGATVSNLDITVNSGTNTITFGSSVTHAIVAGQWIRLNGFTDDDGYHLVSDSTGQVLTVTAITTTETLESVATVKGAYIRNGTVEHSYAIERDVDNPIPQYFLWTGSMIDKMDIEAAAQSILTGTFSFIMEDESAGTVETANAVTEATTNDVMSSAANVANMMEGGSEISGVYVQGITFSIANNLRGIKDITSTGNAKIGTGLCDVTGKLDLIFDNLDIYNKFNNSQSSSLSFRTEDGSTTNEGNCYIFTFHKIKYSDGSITTPGVSQDMPQSMSWQALRHATYDCTVQIDKFEAE